MNVRVSVNDKDYDLYMTEGEVNNLIKSRVIKDRYKDGEKFYVEDARYDTEPHEYEYKSDMQWYKDMTMRCVTARTKEELAEKCRLRDVYRRERALSKNVDLRECVTLQGLWTITKNINGTVIVYGIQPRDCAHDIMYTSKQEAEHRLYEIGEADWSKIIDKIWED